MAVDTRDKRFAMMHLASPLVFIMPNPDGAFNVEADRIHLLRVYRGVAPSGSAGASQEHIQLPMRGMG